MGDPSGFYAKDEQAARQVRRVATRELPAEWLEIIDAEARQARPEWGGAVGHPLARREVYRGWLDEYGGAAASDLTDAQIKAQASAYALEARAMDIGLLVEAGAWHEYARLLEFCGAREVQAPPVQLLLKGMGARVRCQYWWRRALRRMVARKCERGAMSLGLVNAPARQPYASNKAVWRRVDQNRRNAKAAEQIFFENDAGYVRSLAELMATSVSHKAIRRGELMTRIRGCEEMADVCGHAGLFFTLTCPSRFHSTLRHGARNPRHDGSTPRDAQDWLRLQWSRARAELAREGVGMYGFRVAEPHHDGCTHWHALLWFPSELELNQAAAVIAKHWLSDDGREPGAKDHRVNVKRMEKGGASGYIAKYISKNIDDHGIDSHLDDYADAEIGPDLLGDMEIKPAMRVEAWAATWGIRQFQAIGQPPVTVWRELRRIKEREARAAGVGGVVHSAWLAAQKTMGVLADWARYVKAQGGFMLGRACRIVMRNDRRECPGLYGAQERAVPVGVALNIPCARTVWSERRLWRAVESSEGSEHVRGGKSVYIAEALERDAAKRRASAAQGAAPRTGVNNCTDDDEASAVRADYLRGLGGVNEESPPCDVYDWPPNGGNQSRMPSPSP